MGKKTIDDFTWKDKVIDELTKRIHLKIGFHKLRSELINPYEVMFILETEYDPDYDYVRVEIQVNNDNILVGDHLDLEMRKFELVDPKCFDEVVKYTIYYLFARIEKEQNKITKDIELLSEKLEKIKCYHSIMKNKNEN